jgi:ABC-type phosphate transport system permease subunit
MTRTIPKRSMQSGVTAQGEPMVWLSGGMFAIACLMIISLLALVLWQGLSTLWPRNYLLYARPDGALVAGEMYGRTRENGATKLYLRSGNYDVSNQHFLYADEADLASSTPWKPDTLWTVERKEWGNLYGFPKQLSWVDSPSDKFSEEVHSAMKESRSLDREIAHEKELLKRIDHAISDARLAIRKVEISEKSDLQADIDEAVAARFQAGEQSQSNWTPTRTISDRAKNAISRFADVSYKADAQMATINEQISQLEAKRAERTVLFELPIADPIGTLELSWEQVLNGKLDKWETFIELAGPLSTVDESNNSSPTVQVHRISDDQVAWHSLTNGKLPRNFLLRKASASSCEVFSMREHSVILADIVRFFPPNQLNTFQRLGVYLARWWEFLLGEPREAGIEGGFFPAIWGTVVMTLIMSLAVMPFGVLAALYMREYAKPGPLLSAIRISINNLAGVPSIVYGVFGLSFFCYMVGGYIDGGPAKAGFEPWPSATWFSALGLLAVVGIIAFSVALLAGQMGIHATNRRRWLRNASALLWLATLAGIALLLIKTPHFHGFYQAQLPNPTFGKGCLLWAACTLALLTLPVVIVATEEALAAVPNSLREGSYACGAGQWQTIHRIVLPYARPGIITGFILAMARGAGEVAPMMLVGAIPLATELPLDTEFPFIHGSRSFMHLGFQIYSLGFQSQNSEAAKPMVFTATLLLLTIVTLLNQTAIWLRARLRKRFQSSQF